MEECIHEPEIKIENGIIISYCRKCGKILGTTVAPINFSANESAGGTMGVILHD